MSRRIEGRTIEMYQDWELRAPTPEEVREVMGQIKEQIATQTKEKVFGAFEESSEAARLAVETYSDLLRIGGVEAAETEKSDLLQDVPDEEKEAVDGGMLALLSLHRAEHGTEPPRP
jgi:hypothetical protein